jgi:hypothetical protein
LIFLGVGKTLGDALPAFFKSFKDWFISEALQQEREIEKLMTCAMKCGQSTAEGFGRYQRRCRRT